MFLTGDFMGVADAKAMGLISDVAAIDQMTEYAMHQVNQIAKQPTCILQIGKQAFYQQIEIDLS